MYYELNVSLNGLHYFATAERSIASEENAKEMYYDFKKRFPEKDGFKITCTYWKQSGQFVTFEKG